MKRKYLMTHKRMAIWYGISIAIGLVGTLIGCQLGNVPDAWVYTCQHTAVGVLLLSVVVMFTAFCLYCVERWP